MHKPLKRECMHKNSAMDTLVLQCYVHFHYVISSNILFVIQRNVLVFE